MNIDERFAVNFVSNSWRLFSTRKGYIIKYEQIIMFLELVLVASEVEQMIDVKGLFYSAGWLL